MFSTGAEARFLLYSLSQGLKALRFHKSDAGFAISNVEAPD